MQEIQYTPIRSSQVHTQKRPQSRSNRTLERTPQKDSVEIKRTRQKERDKKNQIKGFIAGISAAIALMGGAQAVKENIMPPSADFDTMGNSIVEVADFCDIDPRAIALANNISEDEAVDKIVLPEKMDIENDLAQVYTDGKYAYIIPNDYGISCEDLKEAFNLEDGILKKYNDLSYDWAIDSSVEIHQGYKDYTGSIVPYDGVKVPLNALK